MGGGHSELRQRSDCFGAQRLEGSEYETKLILISDPGQDLDDEVAMIMLRYLVQTRHCSVLGIIATLTPAFDRARLLRGTLDLLGLRDVPIGVGSDGGDLKGQHKATFVETADTYMPARYSECSSTLLPGRKLLHSLYSRAENESITMVIIASLKDAALFLRDNESLFRQKTKEVVIMGGVQEAHAGHGVPLLPDDAHNNVFDAEASAYFYRRCQEISIRLIVVTRHAAYAAPMPRSVYDNLAYLGSAIGIRLRNVQRAAIEQLWTRACGEPGSEARKGLPERCTKDWFLNTFCGGIKSPSRDASDTIWDLVCGFMQYDTLALLAAIPSLRDHLFNPNVYKSGRLEHLVIGESAQDHGIRNAERLISVMEEGYSRGLALNHHHKSQIIVLTQLRWDNQADIYLACTILRTLYGLGIIDCLGILIDGSDAAGRHIDPTVSAPPRRMSGAAMAPKGKESIDDQVQDIKEFLNQLGLSHVPVIQMDANDGVAPLKDLYVQNTAPSGVTLVVTASNTQVAAFASTYPKIFRERTQRLIIMGGALIAPEMAEGAEGDDDEYTGNLVLQPDPAAQNNRLDMESSHALYQIAQAMSVPIVALSRFLAKACCVPRVMFDALDTHGGPLGARICQTQKDTIRELWRSACATGDDRRGLPQRCNREWFVQTFCGSGAPDGDDCWPAVESLNVYNALGICAALPKVVERFLEGTAVQVRSAVHYVVGLSQDTPGVSCPNHIRHVLYQSLFQGVLINTSIYDMGDPPRLPLRMRRDDPDENWEYSRSQDALEIILPTES